MDKFITFGKPQFNKHEFNEVKNVLKSGWVGTGKKTIEFEKKFLKYINAQYGIALNSCTSSLYLSLFLSKIKPGDEVITTSLTFCSTVNSILNIGAKPVLVDIKLNSLQIDEEEIEKKINKKTKAIIVVHMHGYPANIKKIVSIAKKYSLKIIEDCAHSIETKYLKKNVGTFGDFGCFSFYSTKNLTTVEGGMLVCKKKSDIIKAKMLSLHGMSRDAYSRFSEKNYKIYDVVYPGFKMNMPDLNAALGIIQLANIKKNRIKRKKIWEKYQKEFANTNFIRPLDIPKNHTHSYHIYYLRLNKKSKYSRDEIMEILHKNGIGVALHYNSISHFSFYKKYLKNQKFINSEKYGKSAFSIPLTPYLTEREVNKIIKTIIKIDNENK